MNNWERKSFDEAPIEIIDGDRGVNYPAKSDFNTEGYCLFLSTGNVTTNGFNFNSMDFISQKKDEVLRKGKLKRGDIVLTTRGTVGNVAYFSDEIPYEQIRINSGMIILRPNSKEIHPYYLYLFLRSDLFKAQVLSQGSGSAQPQLPIGSLKNIIIPWKNISIQQKIASVLSALDSKIELNNRINAELEAMAKTLYDYWFVQFDFPDKDGKPYKTSGGKMVWNEEMKRDIPEGWEVKYLTEEMDLQYGFPFSTELFNDIGNGIPVIRIRDILNCSISNYSTEEVDDKYRINKGDIIVGMDGNFHINYWNRDNCYLNQRSLRIRSNNESISEIQARYSIEPFIQAREKNVSKTTVAHLSAKDVNDLKILKADNEFQIKANTFFNSNLEKIVSNRIQNQKLTELRDWLLPMLMNGQVRVSEL
jgi:type I restriction enzyme S subunit